MATRKPLSGPALRYWRVVQGLPLRSVAQAVGVDVTTVWRWEAGEHPIPAALGGALARALGVNVGDLTRMPPMRARP